MQVSHGGAWEDRKSTHFLPLLTVPQQICQRYCLIPVCAAACSASATVTNLFSPTGVKVSDCVCMCLCLSLCFCMPCTCLPARGSVRVKPPTNYNLNSSINRELADSAVQMSLGHYHRLSCSSKPEVTTALSVR